MVDFVNIECLVGRNRDRLFGRNRNDLRHPVILLMVANLGGAPLYPGLIAPDRRNQRRACMFSELQPLAAMQHDADLSRVGRQRFMPCDQRLRHIQRMRRDGHVDRGRGVLLPVRLGALHDDLGIAGSRHRHIRLACQVFRHLEQESVRHRASSPSCSPDTRLSVAVCG